MRFLYENALVWLGPYTYKTKSMMKKVADYVDTYLVKPTEKHEILQWVCDLQAVHTSF